jgi:hypothetical protein
MRRFTRLLVLACAAVSALAVAALAAAFYDASMGIFQATYKPGGAGAVTIVVAQQKRDDPTAKITIYVPPGYTTTLGQAAGSTIGSVDAEVQILDTGSTNVFALGGPVKTDNPATYVSNQCSPGLHEAVWTLNAALASQPANPIPVYVDHTAGAEATFSSAKLQVCFRDPNLPAGDPRRSPNGIKFLDAAITVKGIFKNPARAGDKLWRSVFTPYTPGTGIPNAAGTKEAQGVVPMPYTISLKRVRARRGFLRLAGTVNTSGQAPSGVRMELFAAVKKKGKALQFKRVDKTKTKKGKYAFNRRRPKSLTYFFVERPPAEAPCVASALGVPCSYSIISNTISRVIKVPAPRR